MTFWSKKKLIRENRWFKIFEMEPGVEARVSKFMTGEAAISETALQAEWALWGESEQLVFAQAFGVKSEITQEDERILEFMMRSRDERLLASIARCLTRHSNRKMVLSFLIERLQSDGESKANFLDALSKLGDREAIPKVRALHDRLAAEIRRQGAETSEWSILDFVVSCSTLYKLGGETAYRDEIEPFLHHPSESVRTFSKISFEGGPPDFTRT